MDMEFYCVGSDGGNPYVPLMVSSNDIDLDNCPECGRTRYNKQNRDLSLVIEGRGKLPDYLPCVRSLSVVSQRVIDVWQKYDITGYTAFPINKLLDKHRNEVHQDSQYYNVTITGRMELDFERMGVAIEYQCSTCGTIEYNRKPWEFGSAFIKEGSHDGTDLFAAKHFEMAPICTRKMLEIVYNEKLTNFQFKHFETKFIYINSPPPIDLKAFFKKTK